MRVKMMLGAAALVLGLSTSAPAQQFGVGGFGGNAWGGNFGGVGGFGGYNAGFGGVGFGNGLGYGYGYPGAYGYTNGVLPYYQAPPTTYNNLGGLAGAISTQTGKANSYRYGYGQMPTLRRR